MIKPSLSHEQQEILACAARLIVEDGFEYGPAKQQALRQLGLPARTALPSNSHLEDAVQEYINLFCADTQPSELNQLRELAVNWMQIMQDFSPFLSGAVWHGTATRHSDIHLQLFCDDPKMAEIFLINRNIKYSSATITNSNGSTVDALSAFEIVREWQQKVFIHMEIYDFNDIRGALKPDIKGRSPRGDLQAVQALLKKRTT